VSWIAYGCQTLPCRDVRTYKRLVWFQSKHSLAWVLTKDLPCWSLSKLCHFVFTSPQFPTLVVCIRHSCVFIHCQFLLRVPTVYISKSPAIFVLASVRQNVITQSALGPHGKLDKLMPSDLQHGGRARATVFLTVCISYLSYFILPAVCTICHFSKMWIICWNCGFIKKLLIKKSFLDVSLFISITESPPHTCAVMHLNYTSELLWS